MEKKVTVEQNGNILMIGLNRPQKMNAFDVEMFIDLAMALGELNKNQELRCGLLFGHGSHFTGGLDLSQWSSVLEKGIFPPHLPEFACEPFGLFDRGQGRVQKPIVMAVQGNCLTIGFELLLSMDIRIASSDARFAMLEIKRGIYPVGGATIRLLREIGWGNAMRYLLTGDFLSAEEAYRLGIVQEVTEKGRQFERALEIAQTVAKQAPLGVKATLLSARRAQDEGEKAAISRLLPDLIPIMKSEDAAEGIQSFAERREAAFKGQ